VLALRGQPKGTDGEQRPKSIDSTHHESERWTYHVVLRPSFPSVVHGTVRGYVPNTTIAPEHTKRVKQRVGEPVRSWCFRRGQGQRSLTRPTIWARFATRPDRGARRASLRSASVVRRPTCAQRATWAALNDESGPGTDVGRGEPKPRAGLTAGSCGLPRRQCWRLTRGAVL
jgi:hypothetical protein